MGFFKNLKRSLGMAKRFKGGIKEDIVVDEIAERVAEEDIEENHNVDLIIVPGVVFDEKCGRCGRGSGYYDKYLDRIKALNVTTIALAHDLQILPHNYELNNDRWDVSMDMIITEKRIITLKGMIWYD